MKIPIFQIDAFTGKLFGGNPAAVCPLEEWISDELMLSIAKENNLAETAYFVKEGDGFRLKWFTPETEMDLCGHATLASAYVIFEHLGYEREAITFNTMSGELKIKKDGDLLQMDFPSRIPEPATVPDIILKSFSIRPKKVLKARDYFLIYEKEEDIVSLDVDQGQLSWIDPGTGGIICTAPGSEVDFVSRFFTPGAAVFEDPVTGSAHCSLIPYWSEILDKKEMIAYQLSERKGEIHCVNQGERVLISGNAVTYLKGEIEV